MRRLAISSAASTRSQSGPTVTTSRVMRSATLVASGSAPCATTLSTSRSVRIPASCSASVTTAEPTWWRSIMRAASPTECSGPTTTTALLATSRTLIGPRLLCVAPRPSRRLPLAARARPGGSCSGQRPLDQLALLLRVDGGAAGRRRRALRAAHHLELHPQLAPGVQEDVLPGAHVLRLLLHPAH